MKQKTVEKASVGEKDFEDKSQGFQRDLRSASANTAKAGKKAVKAENPEKELKNASEEAVRPFLAEIVRVLREVEKTVYSWFSTPLNPYYFDSDNFSASLRSNSGGYRMEVNSPNKEIRQDLQEEIKEEDC
ncbi:MAG: hypothetical protein H8Z69_06020 [Nanohaloarchaea archaeon]|nr:hypothetical protein [Candidatus Nanohaloarchaea archaeon]